MYFRVYQFMSEPFLIFQSFTDIDLAQEIAEKLRQHNIPLQFDDTSSPIDAVIIGSTLAADLRIKLRQEDFQKAHSILENYYKTQLDSVEKDYYLFDFTNEELQEIVEKSDEWGTFDFLLAQKLLKERGKEFQPEEIQVLKANRIKEIARPERVGFSWIFLGYLISILFSPFGIFFGLAITSFKKTLPNGEWVYSYNENDRKHGKTILIISSCLTSVWILLRMMGGLYFLDTLFVGR